MSGVASRRSATSNDLEHKKGKSRLALKTTPHDSEGKDTRITIKKRDLWYQVP
jgi:hypothetical protein